PAGRQPAIEQTAGVGQHGFLLPAIRQAQARQQQENPSQEMRRNQAALISKWVSAIEPLRRIPERIERTYGRDISPNGSWGRDITHRGKWEDHGPEFCKRRQSSSQDQQ